MQGGMYRTRLAITVLGERKSPHITVLRSVINPPRMTLHILQALHHPPTQFTRQRLFKNPHQCGHNHLLENTQKWKTPVYHKLSGRPHGARSSAGTKKTISWAGSMH
ncbi:hypothetical protein I3842_01G019100 [Carya illinoinensis]|uniref:Uncharacterized protein n=1 Tax=Carya illinoinensis TaxID=32201 RepID=A0A922FVH7_CARIL|nr:hypothetical protein I3842_01G019100 [Carya illinoinensis]